MKIEAYLYYLRISFPIAYQKCIKGRKFGCGGRRGTRRLSLRHPRQVQRDFSSPLVLRDFSSQRPGDGGLIQDTSPHGSPARWLRSVIVYCSLSFVLAQLSPRASGSHLGWRTGENFQELPHSRHQPPFRRRAPRPLTARPQAGHTGLHSPSPARDVDRRHPPTPGILHSGIHHSRTGPGTFFHRQDQV